VGGHKIRRVGVNKKKEKKTEKKKKHDLRVCRKNQNSAQEDVVGRKRKGIGLQRGVLGLVRKGARKENLLELGGILVRKGGGRQLERERNTAILMLVQAKREGKKGRKVLVTTWRVGEAGENPQERESERRRAKIGRRKKGEGRS